MNPERRSPKLAESILSFFSGPNLSSEVLGDLQEQFSENQYSKRWYWRQTISSLPSFCLMRLRNLTAARAAKGAAIASAALTLVWLWELLGAQRISWPIAKLILPHSPLTAWDTCKLAYLIAYGTAATGGLLLPFGWGRFASKYPPLRQDHPIFLATALSTPALYYLLFPQQQDASMLCFRLTQLGIIWGFALGSIALTRAIEPSALKQSKSLHYFDYH